MLRPINQLCLGLSIGTASREYVIRSFVRPTSILADLNLQLIVSNSVSQASASPKPISTLKTSSTTDGAHSSFTTGAVSTAASLQASSNATSSSSPAGTTVVTNSSNSHICHLAYLEWFDGGNGPFCEPVMWQNVWVGREYSCMSCPTARQKSS